MPRIKLTQDLVHKAEHQPTDKRGRDRTIFWDESTRGFGLVVTASGHKSFVYQYRLGSVSRRINLDGQFLRLEATHGAKNGKAPKTYTPKSPFDPAKREAAAVKSAIGLGRDPLAEVRKARNAATGTLKAVAENYLAREGKKLRSIRERKRIFARYLTPSSAHGRSTPSSGRISLSSWTASRTRTGR